MYDNKGLFTADFETAKSPKDVTDIIMSYLFAPVQKSMLADLTSGNWNSNISSPDDIKGNFSLLSDENGAQIYKLNSAGIRNMRILLKKVDALPKVHVEAWLETGSGKKQGFGGFVSWMPKRAAKRFLEAFVRDLNGGDVPY